MTRLSVAGLAGIALTLVGALWQIVRERAVQRAHEARPFRWWWRERVEAESEGG